MCDRYSSPLPALRGTPVDIAAVAHDEDKDKDKDKEDIVLDLVDDSVVTADRAAVRGP
jgi:hypothetical protein